MATTADKLLSLYSKNKSDNLESRKDDKLRNFGYLDTLSASLHNQSADPIMATQPQTTPFTTQTVDRLVDADSAILRGKPDETRFAGFDAYEVQHNDPESIAYFKSPLGIKKMDRQKEHLATQLGIDKSSVTTDMIYKAGDVQNLDALYTLMGRPKGPDGKEWTPGPINYSPTKDGALQLGSKANPLGLKIQEQDLGKDYFGRGLSNIADTQGKLLTDRFDTPAQNTDYNSSYGKHPQISNSPSWKDMPGTFGSGRLSDDIAIAKSTGIQLGAGAIRMVNKAATAMGLNGVMDKLDAAVGGTEHAGMFLKDKNDLPFTNKSIKEVLDPKKGQAVADAMAGLSSKARATFSGAMQQSEGQWEKGDYLGSMWTAAKHLDQLLAQSAPETAALFVPYVGAPLVAATRASNQAEMYKENNPGKEYDASQYAGSFLANMALLLPEKLLIKSGITDVFGKAAKGGHGTAVLKSTAGETVQEYGEGVQEQYATQKEGAQTLGGIMTDPSQVYQGAIGGLIGGAMHGAGIAVSEGPGAVMRMADKGLTAAAEITTGKTANEIKVKAVGNTAINNMIKSNKVDIHEGMSEADIEVANDVNDHLDSIKSLDHTSPTYSADVQTIIDEANNIKEDLTTPRPISESTKSEVQYTQPASTVENTPIINEEVAGSGVNESTSTKDNVPVSKDIQNNKVDIHDGMSDEDIKIANHINARFDRIDSMDPNTTGYKDKIKSLLYQIDNLKSRMGVQPVTKDVQSNEVPADSITNAKDTIPVSKDTTPDDTIEYDAPTKERIDAAGISNVMTQADRESNVRIELIKDGDTRSTTTSKKKPLTLDPATIDDSFVESILNDGATMDTLGSKMSTNNKAINLVKRLAKKLGYGTNQHTAIKEMYSAVKESFNTDAVQHLQAISKDGKMTPAKAMRAVAIASSAIQSATTSEMHIANKANVDAVNGARVMGLDVQIGKEYLNSYGLKVAGGSNQTAAKYAIFGRAILKYMEATGMTTTQDMNVPIHNMVTAKGKSVTDAKEVNTIMKGDKKSVHVPVVKLNTTESSEAMHTFSKLFKPSNYKLPDSEAETNVVHNESNPISKAHQDIIKKYQALKDHVKPQMIKLVKEIRDSIAADGMTTDEALATPKYRRLLGIHHTNAAIDQLSADGKSIGRRGNLINMIDNIDEIEELSKEGMHFSYESAINNRIHVLETILEFQGDKFMGRQMVTQGEYTVDTKNTKAYKLLIDDIVDNLPASIKKYIKTNNISGKEYVEGKLKSKWLDSAMETIAENNGEGMNLEQLQIYSNKMKFTSTFKALSVLQAIYDVRTAKDGKVKTQYMPEADATASGITNTLLNLSGIPAVRKALAKIGIGKNLTDKAIDPYILLVQAFKDKVQPTLYNRMYKKIFDDLDKAGLGERELAKSPAMTSVYGQAPENAKIEMSKIITEMLINKALQEYDQDAMDLINEITSKNYVIDGGSKSDKLEDISKSDVKSIVDFYTNNLTEAFVGAVDDAYPGIAAYRKAMGVIYKALDKSGKWDGKIASAVETMLGTAEGKNRMSVRKLMSMTERDIDNELLSYNEMMNNSTSFNVNLQHSVDAALLLMTLKKVMQTRGDKGIMTVHDAFYADPEVLIDIMKWYNHYTVEVAKKYDFLSIAVKELEAIRTDDNTKEINKAIADANLIMVQATGMNIQELYDAKLNYLDGLNVQVLGNTEIDAGTVTKEESADDTKKSPDTEAEVKESNENIYSTAKHTLDALRRAILDNDGIAVLETIRAMKVPSTHIDLLDKVEKAIREGVEFTIKDQFTGGYDEVSITGKGYGITENDKKPMTIERFVETLAHEVDHAIQLDWMANNKDSSEMKYLERVVKKLATIPTEGMKPLTKLRIAYILDPRKGSYKGDESLELYQVSELVSIISNEQSTAEEILAKFGTSSKTITQIIKDLIHKAYVSFKTLLSTGDVAHLPMDTDTIMSAIQSLDDNARVNTLHASINNKEVRPAGITNPKDVNKKVFINPYAELNDVIARSNHWMSDWMIIWGDTMVEHMGPPLANWNENMKRNYSIYNSVISMIRNGLYDSDWAKRMHQTLRISGDTMEVLMDKVQKLATDYQQESGEDMKHMAEMDRQIKDKYSKSEQVKLYNIFNDTAIANLGEIPAYREKILNGSMALDDVLKELSVKLGVDATTKLDEVASYYSTGITKNGYVNVYKTGISSKEALMYTTVKAMSMIPESQKMLQDMNPSLRDWMMSMALANKTLNAEVNERGMGYDGTQHSADAAYNINYDGNMAKDIYDKVMETKLISLRDMKKTENSSEFEWVVLKQPTENTMGMIGRENLAAGYTPGVGLELNRYVNGVIVNSDQSEHVQKKLDLMKDEAAREQWLKDNDMAKEGNRFRMLISKEAKVGLMGLKQNAAHSLYRTYVHNKDLIASEAVRETLLSQGLRKISSEKGMEILEKILQKNYNEGLRGDRTEVEPFLNIDFDYGTFDQLRKDYPMIAQHYKTPTGMTTYNNFNSKVQLVQRGVYEELLGHKNFSIFGNSDNRTAARWENMYKKIVILAKQKMVVMNPVKLLNDTISNVGVLGAMDMTIPEIWRGTKKGWNAYHEYSKERTKLVQLKLDTRMVEGKAKVIALSKLKAQEEKMKTLAFYDAHEAGFIQSYGTELVLKEYDTISGVQHDMDTIIDKYTHDAHGEPNTLFKAIKWWTNIGVNIDELMYAAGNSAKLKGTTVGEELVAVSERLKNKKNEKDSVARYISEMIGAPSSEAAAYGGAYMVLSDALSKYTLAEYLYGGDGTPAKRNPKTKKAYTKQEAYFKANETFIDYRRNIPSEIKALSDYGIIMFPAYWMRVQKVIGSLIVYHPISSLGSFAIESAMGVDQLNILNQNIFSKMNAYSGIVHTPGEMVGPEALWAVL